MCKQFANDLFPSTRMSCSPTWPSSARGVMTRCRIRRSSEVMTAARELRVSRDLDAKECASYWQNKCEGLW